ncbi:MAG: hypothetical protein WA664_05035 [Candidatus Acidiferrales bacterium]
MSGLVVLAMAILAVASFTSGPWSASAAGTRVVPITDPILNMHAYSLKSGCATGSKWRFRGCGVV